MAWAEAAPRTYRMIPDERRQSNCQIEAEISYRDLITHKPEGEWSVDKALESISEGPELKSGTNSPLPFFHLLERLKTTPREGWRRFGISRYFPLPLSLPF